EADQESDFVNYADESYLIGPPPVNESYLDVDKIIEVAKSANVDAIHPGYGFLSENSTFAKLCDANNMIFIGPSSHLIEQSGDKVSWRNLMVQAGVPVISGSNNALTNTNDASNATRYVGYPAM